MGGAPAHAGGPVPTAQMSVAHGLLPRWLALVWIAVLLIVFIAHCRPLLAAPGHRRLWHGLHLAMALAMAVMYASATVTSITIAGPAWTMVFAAGAIIAAGMLAGELSRQSVSLLWPLAILDLITMAYMLDGGPPVAVISWLLVAYLAAQAALWTTRTGGRLAERAHLGMTEGAGGAVLRSRTLRPALMLMTASMAYMLIAMQLAA